MNRLVSSLFFYTFLFVVIPGIAQHFPFKSYGIIDGMPSSMVYDIAQHPSGMMWFMTKAGPIYYDGNDWYSFADSLNLPVSNNSKIITIDSLIWVAGLNKTAFTIQYFDKKWNRINVPFPSDNFHGQIGFLVVKSDTSYYLILSAQKHLYQYDFATKEWSDTYYDFSIYNIQMVNRKCFISSSDGLWELIDEAIRRVDLPYEDLPSRTILAVNKSDSTLHLLGYNWYGEIINRKIKFLIDDVGLTRSSLNHKSSLVVDRNGHVFFGAAIPARIIDHENQTWYDLLKGENLNVGSTRVFCDMENNIWVSDSRGLFKFNVQRFQNYSKSSGLADNEVSSILELKNGSIILANPFDFNLIKNGSISHYSYQVKKSLSYRILAMDEDINKGQLYMATNNQGLLVYEVGKYESPTFVYSGEKLKINSVKIFKDKTYLTGNSGIFFIQNERLEQLSNIGSIRNIAIIGNTLAFLSTTKGAYIYDGQNFHHCTSPNFDLSSVYHAAIFEGDTLLATRNGVGVIRGKEILPWKNEIIKTPIYALLVDSKGRLWLGADNGILLLHEGNMESFNMNDGLAGNEINRNALIEDSKGNIWIGTDKGASMFKDQTTSFQETNLRVQINEIWVNKNLLQKKNGLQLSPNENDLRITFQCFSYVDEDKLNFRYRIDRANSWIKLSPDLREVVLSNLKPGDYHFEIQASYDTANWGPSTLFEFKINNPFYLKWWFILIAIIFLLAFIRLTFHLRYLYLLKKQKQLKEEVSARTKEIMQLNNLLEKKVMERTLELQDKKERLEQSAFINAHHLRGPLTKMMSALHLMEIHKKEDIEKEMVHILKSSVAELDEVIHSINNVLKRNE